MNLTREQYEALIRRRPHLAGVGQLPNPIGKQTALPALDNPTPRGETSAGGGERFHVTLISLRRRLLDDDNLVAGAKAIRDALAKHLGQDDADISWEYHQEVTKGQEGTIVKISVIKK